MSKINNTTVYPYKKPTANDFFVMTDNSDYDKTVSCKVEDLQSYFGTTTVQVDVTSTEIKNLNTTPKILIPGTAGYYTEILGLVMKYIAGSTPYPNLGNDFFIQQGSTSGAFLVGIVRSFENVGTSTATGLALGLAYPAYDFAGGDNVLLYANTANPTNGDGTLSFDIMYRLVKA